MRISKDLSIVSVFLRWGGLCALVLAVMGGILGMHVVNGTPSAPMGHSGISTAVVADSMTSHPANDHLAAATVRGSGADAQEQINSISGCGCSPDDCTSTMAMHGDCVPTVSSTTLIFSLPGTLTTHAPGTRFALLSWAKGADRIPDPPSLTKLSISRT